MNLAPAVAPDRTVEPLRGGPRGAADALNLYQAATSSAKLQGQVFTPAYLADAVVRLARPGVEGTVVDPACGDGSFLAAVVRARLPRLRGRGLEGRSLAAAAVAGLAGFDIDPACVRLAREALSGLLAREAGEVPLDPLPIEEADFLEPSSLFDSPLLRAVKTGSGAFAGGADLLLGNPPYVEAKRLGNSQKARLRRLYPDAGSGPLDLFVYFVQRSLDLVSEAGGVAFILPNRALVAQYAHRLRGRLLDACGLHSVLFLSHVRVFDGTEVYPVVVCATKRPGPARRGLRVFEPSADAIRAGETGRGARVARRLYAATETRAIFPLPSSPRGRRLLERMVGGLGRARMADVVDFRWTVSFHSAGLRDHFVFAARPASPHARRFLGGGRFAGNAEVQRYATTWAGGWIDYDEARAAAAGNPLPPRSLFDGPKLAICQNALRLRVAVDEEGYVLKDTFIAAVGKDGGHPLAGRLDAVAAVLASDVVHYYYHHVFRGGHVGGGYLHFLAPFLRDIPLGDWSAERAAAVDGLALAARRAATDAEYLRADGELQRILGDVFDLDAAERTLVAEHAARTGGRGWTPSRRGLPADRAGRRASRDDPGGTRRGGGASLRRRSRSERMGGQAPNE